MYVNVAYLFSGKEVKKCFGQSEDRVATLDFESFKKATKLLQNPLKSKKCCIF
jgi:uncharacterized protein (DUF1330 family)